ncbi:MAG: hypothetical protein A3B30_02820 [Candidatus Komeilibacteria bacterium RIFCSPLOWO2_01_FULL_52_15]|uniref:UDP-N-acetylmuramyl-tripeptide synthetase n=2 Tax=Candidatus Komeiliibacteriota TaxID=1817908 RepID=A0A1G2BNJ2_9BACT|nr:MAG: hypothetical protein A2677_02145 [Candidatus Komeilibacteria bacterium RIFCSPHIGHO2_01_FULL_52_14]OGY90668.1 MAG: hypothetical protein A3B30_02820 [Candidatus Komeilibacteria bacterium RIFCSPLOWO2_01_FULL_52_15]
MWQSIKNIYHLFQAFAANLRYGFPSKKLTVVGITGTDGKTTTAALISEILRRGGKKVVTITTLGATIGDQQLDTGLHTTTPSPFSIQRILRKAVSTGCTHAVIEVSSHALDQNRVWGIAFRVGILTNITHEHLDYHKTMERYTAAKTRLLKNSAACVLNVDDSSYKNVAPKIARKTITYALRGSADITPKSFPFSTGLPGAFNQYNCLAAATCCKELGIDGETICKALAHATNPKGRAETVYDKDFKVIIDFAVTPNAFSEILSYASKQKRGRLIHVFGLSGKRDTAKRPVMGRVAAQFDDVIILTTDDPRDESVSHINEEIKRGITGFSKGDVAYPIEKKMIFEIADRKDAINFAIKNARAGDIVILTGKAHEQSLAVGTHEVPWDEYAAVRDALARRSR